jgi:hypothetical protein
VTSKKDLLTTVAEHMDAPFSIEEFVLAAWRAWPLAFGLKGHPDYPCSKRVQCEVYGVKGLVADHILQRVDGGFCLHPDHVEIKRIARNKRIEDRKKILAMAREKRLSNPDQICRHQLRLSECADCLNQGVKRAR